MADYWLTFRLEDNDDYGSRYSALIEAINDNGTQFWEDPTSFVCIRSDLDVSTLGGHLKAAIDPDCDLIVLREIGRDNTRYAGVPSNGFESFFPRAKKL